MPSQSINFNDVDSVTFNWQEVFQVQLQEGNADPQTIWSAGGLWVRQHLLPYYFVGHYTEGQGLHNGKPWYIHTSVTPHTFIWYDTGDMVWKLGRANVSWDGGEASTTPAGAEWAMGGCTIQDYLYNPDGGLGSQKDTPDLAWWRNTGEAMWGDDPNTYGVDSPCGLGGYQGRVHGFEIRPTPGFENGQPHVIKGAKRYKTHS